MVAATHELAQTLDERDALSKLLNAEVPPDWPPPLNDEASAKFFAEYLRANPDAVGWMLWYFIFDDGATRVAIGNGGFKGKPVEGAVEIGYAIVPAYQRRGFAFEAVNALVDWAFEHPDVQLVAAETFPELDASKALLRKLGFEPAGVAVEPGAVRFEKRRAEGRGKD